MKKLALLLPLLALSCSQTEQPANSEAAPAASPANAVAAPVPAESSVAAQGEPYALHLESGTLTFCDKRGGRKLDLKTGRESGLDQACPKKEEPNTSCSGLGLDVEVRAPASEPNDIVDVGGSSFPLKGHVQDCAVDGKVLAVVTGSSVAVIDTAKGSSTEINRQGGDRVTIGHSWIAWTDGSKVNAAPLHP